MEKLKLIELMTVQKKLVNLHGEKKKKIMSIQEWSEIRHERYSSKGICSALI